MLFMYIQFVQKKWKSKKLHNYVSYVKNDTVVKDDILRHREYSIDLVMSFDQKYSIYSHHRSGKNWFTLNWRYNFNGFFL